MKRFDRAFGELVKGRFSTLAEDVTPEWGKMTRGQVYGHLNQTLNYTLGQGPEMPFRGNFKTKHIFRHVVLYGLREIPRGIKLPRPEGVSEEMLFPVVTLDTFQETIDTYVARLGAPELPTRIHPFFGPLTPAQWQLFHRRHFTHHMKQFGLGDGL